MLDIASAAEAIVVALARTGDERAYGELVRRRQLQIRSMLLRLCRDPALSDDLAQETFLQAWRRLHTLKADGAFGGWLRQIASNTWLQHVRQRDPIDKPIVDWVDPTTESSTGDAIDLDRALSRLVPIERLCVVLSYNEGMSHGEISTATELPLGTVKTHIANATQFLRSLLSAHRCNEPRK